MDGKVLWICDFRYLDNKYGKPIRHIKPTKVLVRNNSETTKLIYYSESHFIALGKNDKNIGKVISLFDNTDYRSIKGTPVQIFDTETKCIKQYQIFVSDAIKILNNYKIQEIERIEKLIKDLK